VGEVLSEGLFEGEVKECESPTACIASQEPKAYNFQNVVNIR
jgi:hypothetical protein